MSNILISHVNQVDAAMVAGSSIGGDMDASNVVNSIIGKRARLLGGSSYLDFDFGADVAIDVLCLRFPRDTVFPTSGTINHAFDANGGTPGAGVAADSGSISIGTYEGYGYHTYVPTSQITARYWRATFNVANSFIDIGRAWAGEKFVPTRNVSYGAEDLWGDRSTLTVARRSGAEYVDDKARQRAFSFNLPHLTPSDADEVKEIVRSVGKSKQLLVVRDPGASDLGRQCLLGRFASPGPVRQTHFNLYSTPLELRESL